VAEARDRLIVALDFADVAEARAFVARAGASITFYKVGLELVLAGGGLDLVRDLKDRGKRAFLDMKLLDIPNTVEKACRSAARTGADFLTIHAVDTKTCAAAAAGAAGSSLKILGVTVLTSLDQSDLGEQGISAQPQDMVVTRAKLAQAAGCHGVVASGQEASAVRQATGEGFAIVTPGIRLPSDAVGDQARVATPQSAIADGASYLVVGRPITQASDPKAAADAFAAAIAGAANI
jgi:orotidine-5'-phosphate decarboxylase